MLRPARAVVTTRTGLRITFGFPAQLIPTLALLGDLVEPELEMLPAVLGPGAVAVDVGASIGTWSLVAGRTGAVVHACEPDDENLEVLRLNLAQNALTAKVVVHRLALGSVEATGRLDRHDRRYLNRVHAAAPVHCDALRLTTLDTFAHEQGLTEVDLLKVNTAGGEVEVLMGAAGLLRERRVRVALFLDSLQVRPELLALTRAGYDLGVWDPAAHDLRLVWSLDDLDAPRPTPMNHYLVLRRRSPG